MADDAREFEYQVCYGVVDRVTFSNGQWLGADIPEAQRKASDIEACPFVWDFLEAVGRDGWELITILESPAKNGVVRTYFFKREK
jgi:hypothetical protein